MTEQRKVRIVGGGLTGILAAFEAHRLGFRDIELHERFDLLGGAALPRVASGLEVREQPIAFGPPGDPMRSLLEGYGLAFDDVENRFGSVSPLPSGDLAIAHDFAGPSLRTPTLRLGTPAGDTLADRLRCYPEDIAQALARYCQWRLGGAWLDEIHASAAGPLGISRVHPIGPETVDVARLKKSDPHYDGFYGIPRDLWGRLQNTVLAQPRGGLAAFFSACGRELVRAGVTIHTQSLVSPRQAQLERNEGDVLVWACDPTALFKPLEIPAPTVRPQTVATYVFKARYFGPAPFRVCNFTTDGGVFRAHLYESRGQVMLAAECVRETPDNDLRREIHRLMSPFGGSSLALQELVSVGVTPRWGCHTVETVTALRRLRAAASRGFDGGFVSCGWEASRPRDAFAEIQAQLADARAGGLRSTAAA